MRLNLSEHKVQVIHGDVFQKPWVSEVCVHGELASQRGGVFSCIFGKKEKKKKETKNILRHSGCCSLFDLDEKYVSL